MRLADKMAAECWHMPATTRLTFPFAMDLEHSIEINTLFKTLSREWGIDTTEANWQFKGLELCAYLSRVIAVKKEGHPGKFFDPKQHFNEYASSEKFERQVLEFASNLNKSGTKTPLMEACLHLAGTEPTIAKAITWRKKSKPTNQCEFKWLVFKAELITKNYFGSLSTADLALTILAMKIETNTWPTADEALVSHENTSEHLQKKREALRQKIRRQRLNKTYLKGLHPVCTDEEIQTLIGDRLF